MPNRPTDSLYFSVNHPPALATLNDEDTIAYLARLNLPSSLAAESPSLELLSKLLLAHQLSIPYDTSALHVHNADWNGESKEIELGSGPGMQLGRDNFRRVVHQGRGGFCFALNSIASALLRGFGFRVSEVGTRVYMHRGKNPAEEGYLWSAVTHELMIVDWEGSDQRWVFDVGFGGGGCPKPIPLYDGAVSTSLSPYESFLLRAEPLPLADDSAYHDAAPGWTLYRRVLPKGVKVEDYTNIDPSPGFFTPCAHFTLATLNPDDVAMANFFNEKSPSAVWANFLAVTILLDSGARKTLAYPRPKAGEQQKAKLFTKDSISSDETDVRFFDFDTASIRDVLRSEFGFKFE